MRWKKPQCLHQPKIKWYERHWDSVSEWIYPKIREINCLVQFERVIFCHFEPSMVSSIQKVVVGEIVYSLKEA